MGLDCIALGFWEELPCYSIVSLIVVWLVPGMWAIVFNLCCFSVSVCIGLMPLSYDFRGGVVRFSFALATFGFLYCS